MGRFEGELRRCGQTCGIDESCASACLATAFGPMTACGADCFGVTAACIQRFCAAECAEDIHGARCLECRCASRECSGAEVGCLGVSVTQCGFQCAVACELAAERHPDVEPEECDEPGWEGPSTCNDCTERLEGMFGPEPLGDRPLCHPSGAYDVAVFMGSRP